MSGCRGWISDSWLKSMYIWFIHKWICWIEETKDKDKQVTSDMYILKWQKQILEKKVSVFVFHNLGHFPEFNGRINENKADFPAAADVAVIIHPDIEKNKKKGGARATRGQIIVWTAAADASAQRMDVHVWFICMSKYRSSFFKLQAFKGFLDHFYLTLSLDNGFNQDWYCKYHIVVFSRFLSLL